MKDYEKVLQLAEKNKGLITSCIVDQEGISRMSLKYLVSNKKLVKVTRGVYRLPNMIEDEFLNLQNRYKKGIYSFETALFLLNYLDDKPDRMSMTFPDNYNLTNVKKDNVKTHQNKDEFYNIGIIDVLTPYGIKVKCYSIEKTICDLLASKDKKYLPIIKTAFKKYINSETKNTHTLQVIAKFMKVDNIIQNYLDILM